MPGAALRPRTWPVVNDVTFEIFRGESLGLVGESGSGKTTLGRSLLRLVEPHSGEVWFDGVDVLRAPTGRLRQIRRRMQMVFQDAQGSLNPRRTCGWSVEEPLITHRVDARAQRRERVLALLASVGLRPEHADRYPHELSGGQRQRVSIARALALEPMFIVCDEPVSALDVSIQAQTLNLLADLQRQRGLTLLFISHDLNVVSHFCDRVAVMYLGRIVELAPTLELMRSPTHPYTRVLLSSAQPRDPQTAAGRLPGEPPNPMHAPGGCALHPRCPHATAECKQHIPALSNHAPLNDRHLVACHHASMLAQKHTD